MCVVLQVELPLSSSSSSSSSDDDLDEELSEEELSDEEISEEEEEESKEDESSEEEEERSPEFIAFLNSLYSCPQQRALKELEAWRHWRETRTGVSMTLPQPFPPFPLLPLPPSD